MENEHEWRHVFQQKPVHDIRQIVYDTRSKAAAKKAELRTVVRHSHRELLKTANTVVQMQDTLGSLNLHYAALQTWTPEIITIHAKNAEKYQRQLDQGNELRISSAIGFTRACLSITESHGSLLLCAKAVLAGRLAVNTLPKDSEISYQSLRDRFSVSRSRLLKRIDEALHLSNPLDALVAFSLVTGSSASEVLEHFLSTQFNSVKVALELSNPDASKIIHDVRLITSVFSDASSLFPFTFQKAVNELKAINLLDHRDLIHILRKRDSHLNLWIQPDVRRFMIWTKAGVLEETDLKSALREWMEKVETLLKEKAAGLFSHIEEIQILYALWVEVLSLLVGGGELEARVCQILTREILSRTTQVMAGRIHRIQELAKIAREIGAGWNDVALSLWDPVTSKQIKLENILSLKATKDKPIFKFFSSRYASIMDDIRWGEEELSQFKQLSQEQNMEVDVQSLFSTVQDTIATEFATLAKTFEAILDEILGESPSEHQATRVLCWLRLVSLVLTSQWSGAGIRSFESATSKIKAQEHLAGYIAAKVGSFACDRFTTRDWKDIPEKAMWEGDPAIPTQPTRLALSLVTEMATLLDGVGSDLLVKDFVTLTRKACSKTIASACQTTCDLEISNDSAVQLLADVLFLQTVLSTSENDEFLDIRKRLLEMSGETDLVRLGNSVNAHWKKINLLFTVFIVDSDTAAI